MMQQRRRSTWIFWRQLVGCAYLSDFALTTFESVSCPTKKNFYVLPNQQSEAFQLVPHRNSRCKKYMLWEYKLFNAVPGSLRWNTLQVCHINPRRPGHKHNNFLSTRHVSTVHPSSSVLHILKSPLNLNRARCYKFGNKDAINKDIRKQSSHCI